MTASAQTASGKLGMPVQLIVFDAIDGALVFGYVVSLCGGFMESNPTIERITFKLEANRPGEKRTQ